MEEIITSGFYKETEDGWLYAKNEVVAPNYTLSRKEYEEIGKDENKEGWIWYDESPKEYTDWIELVNKKILELKGE